MIYITDYIDDIELEEKIYGNKIYTFNDTDVDHNKVKILLVWHQKIDAKFLDLFPNVKFIQRYGVGFEFIDLKECNNRNIVVSNNPDYGVEEVAVSALSLILNLLRGTVNYDYISQDLIRNESSSWQENTIKNLRRPSELSLSILGYGRIGQKLAFLSKNIFKEINIYDPYLKPGTEKIIRANLFHDMDEFLGYSNILSIHCPLTEETRGIVNKNFLKKLPRESILVNTARGPIIEDVNDILNFINSGQLIGLGLDVLPEEPPTMNNFFRKYLSMQSDKNIIINPHTSYYSIESYKEMRIKAIQNCIRFIDECNPNNIVSH